MWVPAVMSVVAAGAQYADTRQQRKKADAIALDSLRQTSQRQKKADSVTQELLNQFSASDAEGEKRSTLQGFMQQLQRAQPDSQAGLQSRGGESETFRRDAADAALGVQKQGERYAGLASRLDAPALQRERERNTLFDRGMDIGLVGREQEGADRHTRLLLSNVRSNPWLQAMSTAASAYGSAYGAGGAGGASSNAAAQSSAQNWAAQNWRGLAGAGW